MLILHDLDIALNRKKQHLVYTLRYIPQTKYNFAALPTIYNILYINTIA